MNLIVGSSGCHRWTIISLANYYFTSLCHALGIHSTFHSLRLCLVMLYCLFDTFQCMLLCLCFWSEQYWTEDFFPLLLCFLWEWLVVINMTHRLSLLWSWACPELFLTTPSLSQLLFHPVGYWILDQENWKLLRDNLIQPF